MDKIKVLFLSANPVATPKLQLDEEIRQIGIKLRRRVSRCVRLRPAVRGSA